MRDQLLREIIEEAGYACTSYSGRGTHGQTCLATDPGPSRMAFVSDLIGAARAYVGSKWSNDDALDELQDALRQMATYQLGKFTVVYFPEYTG